MEESAESKAVKDCEQKYKNAIIAKDISMINEILADDYFYYNSSGEQITKEYYLSALQDGLVKYIEINYEDEISRIFADTAIFTALLHEKGQFQDQQFDETFRLTRIYIRQKDNKWRAVAGQLTRIAKVE